MAARPCSSCEMDLAFKIPSIGQDRACSIHHPIGSFIQILFRNLTTYLGPFIRSFSLSHTTLRRFQPTFFYVDLLKHTQRSRQSALIWGQNNLQHR